MIKNHKFFLAGLSIILVLFYYAVFSERGLLKVRELSMERDRIRMQAETVAAENRRLKEEAEALRHDIRAIEKAARSQLDLVREDEILYKFTE